MPQKLTDQELLDKGFKQFNLIPRFDPDGVEIKFQKRYDDNVGKRYFITVIKWKPVMHPYTKEIWPATYEFGVQLYKKDCRHDGKAVDLLFHSTWGLDEVEDYMQKLFDTGLFDYYEKWEEN